jgi:hypothetical protein
MAVTAKPESTETLGTGIGTGVGALSNYELARLNDSGLLAELARTTRAKEALSGREAQLGARWRGARPGGPSEAPRSRRICAGTSGAPALRHGRFATWQRGCSSAWPVTPR